MKRTIEAFARYNSIYVFLGEFIDFMEKEETDFKIFMEYMYGGIDEFKKYNFKDFKEDYEVLQKYLKDYAKIERIMYENNNI